MVREVIDLGIEPASIASEDMRRIRIITTTTIGLCVVLGLPAFAQFWLLDLPWMAAALALAMVAAAANLVVLRSSRRPDRSGHIALAILASLLILSNTTTGGFDNPNFAWLYVLPLGAAVLINLRGAAVWTVLTMAVTCGFWTLPQMGFDFPNLIPPGLQAGNDLFNRLSSILAIGVIAASFVAGQRRAERQLAAAHDDLLRETAYVQLLRYAAVSANEATSFDDALRDSMERICDVMDWVAGHVYHVRPDGRVASSGALYGRDPRLAALREAAEARSFGVGSGLVGRAVERRTPQITYKILPDDVPEALARVVSEIGIESQIAFPIYVDGVVTAAMEFISTHHLEDTDRLRAVFSSIGTQLGKVAERTALQERLQQSQKMEAVGQLAAGVAHEINNPMSYVRSNLNVLREQWSALWSKLPAIGEGGPGDLREGLEDCQELVEETLEGVERTIAIVRDIREFSHMGSGDRSGWESADIRELLESARRVAAPRVPAGLRITAQHDPAPPCRCSPNQLRQVFVNLIINAVQALGEQGEIRLSTGIDGGEIFARVQDDGPGMTEATRQRLFDPFFTTKPVGEGTGLGLSVSYEIVRNHGGEIIVEAEPGVGACFEIRLPAEVA